MCIQGSKEAYQLLHDGSLALSQIELNGIRIDIDLLDKEIEKMDERIKELNNQLESDEVWRTWKKYKRSPNIDSDTQLAHILFKIMKVVSQ